MQAYPLELSVDELMARSREIAGVDLIDEEAIEPLTVLHRALCEQSQLDEEGARWQTKKLLRLLINRLRMKRDFQNHPEIADQQLKGPVVVMGMARSGTTKLQKALAASGDFNWLTFWQNYWWASVTGAPNEPVDERIAAADEFCRWHEERSPDAKYGHSFETMEPEEESHLSEGCLISPALIGYVEIPSYAAWLATKPFSVWFEFLRDALKYFQWQGLASPDKPWLLKAPIYNGLELEILKALPDARLVMAHRSPLKTIPSMCKYVTALRHAYSKVEPDMSMILDGNFGAMDAHLANRRAHPELPLLDLRFEEITDAFPAAIEKIYAHAGLPLGDASRTRILRWNDDNRMHKLGEHKYSLEQFGLTEAFVREKMAGYFEFLGI